MCTDDTILAICISFNDPQVYVKCDIKQKIKNRLFVEYILVIIC